MVNLVSFFGGNLGEVDVFFCFKVGMCGYDEVGNIYCYV